MTRSLIDQTIALCGIDGGVVGSCGVRRPLTEGGREVWDFIRRLRIKGFVRAGLDPDLLLTRDQVVELALKRLKWIEMTIISGLEVGLLAGDFVAPDHPFNSAEFDLGVITGETNLLVPDLDPGYEWLPMQGD